MPQANAAHQQKAVLQEIVAAHRRAAAADERSIDDLLATAEAAPRPRPFQEALVVPGTLTLIAEIKRRSPSAGALAADLDPAALARAYEEGGASAISVLTDSDYFGGSPEDLIEARSTTHLPALRKDFTVTAADICDARIMGADAILLIVAVLDDAELRGFIECSKYLELSALVEVHTEEELERACNAGAGLIGVNSRDLNNFEVDLAVAEGLGPSIPAGVVRVAESGIKTAEDAQRLADAGYHAILVGTSILTATDPADQIRALTG